MSDVAVLRVAALPDTAGSVAARERCELLDPRRADGEVQVPLLGGATPEGAGWTAGAALGEVVRRHRAA
ncbi:MAG TPA: hypothetical protein VIH01_07010 [Blastococcus sp.]